MWCDVAIGTNLGVGLVYMYDMSLRSTVFFNVKSDFRPKRIVFRFSHWHFGSHLLSLGISWNTFWSQLMRFRHNLGELGVFLPLESRPASPFVSQTSLHPFLLARYLHNLALACRTSSSVDTGETLKGGMTLDSLTFRGRLLRKEIPHPSSKRKSMTLRKIPTRVRTLHLWRDDGTR